MKVISKLLTHRPHKKVSKTVINKQTQNAVVLLLVEKTQCTRTSTTSTTSFHIRWRCLCCSSCSRCLLLLQLLNLFFVRRGQVLVQQTQQIKKTHRPVHRSWYTHQLTSAKVDHVLTSRFMGFYTERSSNFHLVLKKSSSTSLVLKFTVNWTVIACYVLCTQMREAEAKIASFFSLDP